MICTLATLEAIQNEVRKSSDHSSRRHHCDNEFDRTFFFAFFFFNVIVNVSGVNQKTQARAHIFARRTYDLAWTRWRWCRCRVMFVNRIRCRRRSKYLLAEKFSATLKSANEEVDDDEEENERDFSRVTKKCDPNAYFGSSLAARNKNIQPNRIWLWLTKANIFAVKIWLTYCWWFGTFHVKLRVEKKSLDSRIWDRLVSVWFVVHLCALRVLIEFALKTMHGRPMFATFFFCFFSVDVDSSHAKCICRLFFDRDVFNLLKCRLRFTFFVLLPRRSHLIKSSVRVCRTAQIFLVFSGFFNLRQFDFDAIGQSISCMSAVVKQNSKPKVVDVEINSVDDRIFSHEIQMPSEEDWRSFNCSNVDLNFSHAQMILVHVFFLWNRCTDDVASGWWWDVTTKWTTVDTFFGCRQPVKRSIKSDYSEKVSSSAQSSRTNEAWDKSTWSTHTNDDDDDKEEEEVVEIDESKQSVTFQCFHSLHHSMQ